MTNAWSLLYDELNMTKTLGEEDYGYMLNLGTPIPGGMSDDTITFTSTGYDGLDLGDPGPFAAQPCLLYTSPSPRDATLSRMPSSA